MNLFKINEQYPTGAPLAPIGGEGPGLPARQAGVRGLLLISARFPPAICGVGDHTAGLQHYLQGRGHSVQVATGTPEAAGQQDVFVWPPDEDARMAWLVHLVQQQRITTVLWQYSPYALHPGGMPGWVVKAMKTLRKAGVRQAVYFHEVRIRYTVPGVYNKLRAWQQQRIATAILRICDTTATSISFYLPYLTLPAGRHGAGNQSTSAEKQSTFSARFAQILSFFAVKKSAVNEIRLIPVPPNIPSMPQSDTTVFAPLAELFPYVRIEKGLTIAAFSNRALPAIIEALGGIKANFPGMKIVWVGHAPQADLDTLRQQMAHFGLTARITGAQPLDVLATELGKADILLLPQPLDNNGEGGISLKNGTLSAAMAAGKAIIATRGDMTDTLLLQQNDLLHLVADNETATWQEAIARLGKDAAYRLLLGQNARIFYEERLSWDVVGKELEMWMLGRKV